MEMQPRPLTIALCALLLSCGATAQPNSNPAVKQLVEAISEERIAATLKKLESFGTRHVMSAQDDPAHGIGATKRWIHDEFASYSPRLQVSYHNFSIKNAGRDVELSNVVAIL